MKRLLLASVAIAAGAAFAVAPAQAQKTYKMKIGMVTINDSNHFSANFQKKYIEEKSGGRIKVGVFPAAQLGKVPRQIEGVQLGTQEAFNIPPGFFIGIDKRFMVTDAPGMFDDMAHAQRALEHPKFRDKFVNLGADKGFIINYLWACGDTSIATVKPFKTLADLKGRKIRVLATPLEREVIKTMGATGIPMPYSEVLPGMQRKTIDGVRSAIIVMHPSKFWTVAKHITLTGMGQISCGQFLSTAWLKKLPSDLRQIVMDSGKAVQPKSAGWGQSLTKKAEENWAKDATVHRLSAADQAELRKRVSPIADQILENDPATKDMYALLKEAVAATRK
jgi:TRAP-type transport system periplasmic protein